MPKRSKIRDAVNGLTTIMSLQSISPADFTHFFGVIQRFLLANRPMLSCLGNYYQFARAEDYTAQLVLKGVLRELLLVISLLPALVQDLRLPWSERVYATDGAQDYGYRGASASCSPVLARKLASASRQDTRSTSARCRFVSKTSRLNPVSPRRLVITRANWKSEH